jgi:formamidopyrimidine-DNA glycosylase
LSVELPEAMILAKQMKAVLVDKTVKLCDVREYEKLQKFGFFNKDINEFNRLVGCRIESVMQRGGVVRLKMTKKMNLVFCPDYGANIHYHESVATLPKKYHLKIDFSDGTFLTARQTGLGLIYSATDQEVDSLYVMKRDFSDIPSPIGEQEFSFSRFDELLKSKNQNIKSAIVGKSAVVVGLSNAAFQEIIYSARIHPKRNTSTLTDAEKHRLYDAMKEILNSRVSLGGKNNWTDLHGNLGQYTPLMGPNMKDKKCPKCGMKIEKLSHGGGQVYLCPKCQM